MDLATLLGLVIGFGALVASVFLENGQLSALFSLPAFVLILGGTIGATVIGYKGRDLRKVPGLILSAFAGSDKDPHILIDQIVKLAEKARREGLLALQSDLPSLDHPLLARGVQLIVDGTDPEVVRESMEAQVEMAESRKLNAASTLEAAGGYAPTMGIIGTVLGLVQTLSNIADAAKLASSIALAFLATLWGILTANLIWLPLASKAKQNIKYESLINSMCIAGVVGLQTGEPPRALREKLEVYVADVVRDAYRPSGDEYERP